MMNYYLKLKHCLLSCILILVITPGFTQLNNPLFHYKFEDGSGNFVVNEAGGLDGEIMGTYDTTWVKGYEGGGFLFDGATFIEVPQQGLNSNSGSFAAWVKGYSGGRIKTIFSAGDNTDGGGFGPENEMHLHLEEQATDIWAGGEASFFQNNGGGKEFFIWSDPDKGLTNPAVPPVNPATFIDTVWRHLAVTWGGGFVKMYVNGDLLVDTAWTPVASDYNFSVIRIGSMLNGGRAYEGVLDEVQGWDWILSDSEVQEAYGQAVGIWDNKTPAFLLNTYPNPAKNQLNVEFASKIGKTAEVSLLNIHGQVLSLESFVMAESISRQMFDVSTLSSGIYMVKVSIEGDTSFEKVIIE